MVGAQRVCSPAGAGERGCGRATARAGSTAGKAGNEGAGAVAAAQAECARLRAEAQALFGYSRRAEEERRWGTKEATNRRWEARWRAREAKERAARVRRLLTGVGRDLRVTGGNRRMRPADAGAIGGWRAGGCGRLGRWLATGGNRQVWLADIGAVDRWTASGCG